MGINVVMNIKTASSGEREREMPAYDNIIHMAAVCIHFNTIHGSFIFICSFVQSGMASTITYTFYIVKSMVEREREYQITQWENISKQ